MKVDIRGKYIPIRTIKSQDEWEKVIEAFVALGAVEWEGREGKSDYIYSDYWWDWSYIGVDEGGEITHFDRSKSYSGECCDATEISKEDLFSLVEGGGIIECADKTAVAVPDDMLLISRESLERVRDTLEFWINREDRRGTSESDYRTWLSLGHRSEAMCILRRTLAKQTLGADRCPSHENE